MPWVGDRVGWGGAPGRGSREGSLLYSTCRGTWGRDRGSAPPAPRAGHGAPPSSCPLGRARRPRGASLSLQTEGQAGSTAGGWFHVLRFWGRRETK